MKIARLSIIGLGLIGASIALATRRRLKHCQITGYDISNKVRSEAIRLGVVHHATSFIRECASDADLIIIATPLSSVSTIFQQISPNLADVTVVTDVCSTKRTIVRLAGEILADGGRRFVGSHPMFGSEHTGLAAADATLVTGSRCILTPTKSTHRAAIKLVASFWKSLGMKPMTMTAGEHDRRTARASHLPQALASILAAQQTADSLEVSGRGLLDASRLAGSNPQLWAEIFIDNAENVSKELTAAGKSLNEFAAAVKRAEVKKIIALMQKGRAARQQLVGRR